MVTEEKGKPFTVRYEEVNAMLLNEFLKEHRRVAEQVRQNRAQEQTISELKSALAQQQKEIKAFTAGLHKVRWVTAPIATTHQIKTKMKETN